jgi:hypothetical protein
VANLWLFFNFRWLFWLFLTSNLAIFSYFNLATLTPNHPSVFILSPNTQTYRLIYQLNFWSSLWVSTKWFLMKWVIRHFATPQKRKLIQPTWSRNKESRDDPIFLPSDEFDSDCYPSCKPWLSEKEFSLLDNPLSQLWLTLGWNTTLKS